MNLAIFTSLFLVVLVGAGCAIPSTSALSSRTKPSSQASSTTSTSICQSNGIEDESGAHLEPIADVYQKLPALGQIYTALDCGNYARIQQIRGMKDGFYQDGIRFRWANQEPPIGLQTLLTNLGFKKTAPMVWDLQDPISLKHLIQLQPYFNGQMENPGFVGEDCIHCG